MHCHNSYRFFVMLWVVVAPLAAQQRSEPKRPSLPDGADTNDARAYYELGVSKIPKRPDDAADAFYWAARIAPEWAAPLYARRVALLLENQRRLVGYVERRESVLRSRDVQRIDSLEYRARQLDPFLHRHLDWELVHAYLTESAMQSLRREYGTLRVEEVRDEVEHWVNNLLQGAVGTQWRAWRSYSYGQFHDALRHYGDLLDENKDRASVHLQRGQIFYLLQQLDSAQVQLSQALDYMRERDKDELVILYESKAMVEYSIGMVLEAAGKLDEAREAYSRALMEDMAFYAAHLGLGWIAMAKGDTASALTDFQMAVEIEPNLPGPRAILGEILSQVGRHAEAIAQLERVVELDPYYARPYLALGMTHEAQGDTEAAIARYREFAERALADDELRDWALDRIDGLGGP